MSPRAGRRATRSDHPAKRRGPPATVEGLGQVLDFMRVIWAVDHGLQSISKKMLAARGVTGPQRLVALVVARRPGISAGSLAVILHLHPSTLTGVLDRLQRRGDIIRRRDPLDGRRALFYLTARGARLNRMKSPTVETAVRRALSRSPRRTVSATRRFLRALASALEEEERAAVGAKRRRAGAAGGLPGRG